MNLYSLNIRPIKYCYSLESLFSNLHPQKVSQIRKYIRTDDQWRSALAELLLRDVIHAECKLDRDEIIFCEKAHGKPILNDHPNFHFNVSHSGDWIVCVTAPYPVGIDVQLIKSVSEGLAQRFFTAEEYHSIAIKTGKSRLHHFFKIWVLKESYIKMIGLGMNLPLNSFAVEVNNKTDHARVLYSSVSDPAFLKLYDFVPEYQLAVCACEDIFTDRLIERTLDQIFEI